MTARQLGVWPDRSPEWHAARAGRIGGSDIGQICGWGFRSRAQLLAEKLGEPALREPTPEMERGIFCEPAALAWLSAKKGVSYDEHRSSGTWVDVDRDWMMYNPDAVTTDNRLVEVKTCGVRDAEHDWGRAGTDQVPLHYAAQAQWGMHILGLAECLMPVLAGAPRFAFALYRLRYDPRVAAYLIDQGQAFIDELRAAGAETSAA